MDARLLGKIALGRASGDDFLELLSSMGMEMENEEIPCEAVPLVAAVEPVIRRGLDNGGTFRRIQLTPKDGGRVTAFILFEK